MKAHHYQHFESHNHVELAFSLAQLPDDRVGVYFMAGNKRLLGSCIGKWAAVYYPIRWNSAPRKEYAYTRCALCGNHRGWTHSN